MTSQTKTTTASKTAPTNDGSTSSSPAPRESAVTNQRNIPSHEIFTVEGEGKDTQWTKVGVAFPTKSGRSHRVLIGQKGDPKQKVYLVCPNSQFDSPDNARPGEDKKRIPYANVYDATDNNVDFKRRDGVAFLNRDDSLSLLIGEAGDPQQLRYQMRQVRPPRNAA